MGTKRDFHSVLQFGKVGKILKLPVKVRASNLGYTCQKTLSQPACYFIWALIMGEVVHSED